MNLTVEEPLAIALYLGLLMESDDFGIFEWKPMTIKARILPAATVEIPVLLQALVRARFVMEYEIDGRKLGAVRNFCRYQRPKKPSAVHPRTELVDQWVSTAPTEKPHHSRTSSEPVPNHSPTGTEKSPQMEDGGWRMEGGGGKEEAAAAARDLASEGPSFETECRRMVEPEPIMLAQDFHLVSALISEGVTEEDVRTGIREALERRSDPQQRYRSWSQIVGWCRTAAKNRLGAGPRASPKLPKPPPPDPSDPMLEFPGGFRRRTSFVRKAISKWHEQPNSWPFAVLGAPPDSSGCSVPMELLHDVDRDRPGTFEAMSALVN